MQARACPAFLRLTQKRVKRRQGLNPRFRYYSTLRSGWFRIFPKISAAVKTALHAGILFVIKFLSRARERIWMQEEKCRETQKPCDPKRTLFFLGQERRQRRHQKKKRNKKLGQKTRVRAARVEEAAAKKRVAVGSLASRVKMSVRGGQFSRKKKFDY